MNSKILKFNEAIVKVVTVATESTADTSEVFNITPDYADYKNVLEIGNPEGTGAVTVTIPAGELWGGKGDLSFEVATGTAKVVELEEGRFGNADGIIPVSLAPASGEDLATMEAYVSFIETK